MVNGVDFILTLHPLQQAFIKDVAGQRCGTLVPQRFINTAHVDGDDVPRTICGKTFDEAMAHFTVCARNEYAGFTYLFTH